ncbi:MAG: TetR family transcriptional regulator [Streptomyces oryziradicis]|nr:TetR family transcriptional regulator [Actinacidiphila oryziradicis]
MTLSPTPELMERNVTPASDSEPRLRRSRLSPEREIELYNATIELLSEVGYEAMTMDAVAARAHSSKATLYRQWQGKPGLVIAALKHHKPVTIVDIDTGSLRDDLYEIARRHGTMAHTKQDAALMSGMTHAVRNDAELGRALRTALVEPENEALGRMLARAVERGELAADVPAARFLPHLIAGAVFFREMIDGEPADEAYLRDAIDSVILPALQAPAR